LARLAFPPEFQADPRRGQAAASVAANEIARGNPDRAGVALTFDAGWDSAPTPALLEALAAHKVQATFFLTGRWAERHPSLVRRIAREGHEIANHSYTHPRFTELTKQEILAEVWKTDALLRELTGRAPTPYVRLPYGDRDVRTLKVLIAEGFVPIYWTCDGHDWMERITAAEVEERVLSHAEPGAIILLHATTFKAAEALPAIIQGLRAKGLEPGPVSSVLQR